MPTGYFTLLCDKKAHFVQGYDNITGIDVALSDVLAGDALSSWPETDEVALKDKRIRWCGLVETMQEKRGAGRSGEANKFWVTGVVWSKPCRKKEAQADPEKLTSSG
jgi:hypothetical protein